MPTTAVPLNVDFRVIIGRIKRIRATRPNFMAAFYGAVGVLAAALLLRPSSEYGDGVPAS